MEGGDDGASERAPLVSGRRMKKRKEDMIGGSHIQDKYLGVTLADRPPIPSGPSAVFPGCYRRRAAGHGEGGAELPDMGKRALASRRRLPHLQFRPIRRVTALY